MKKEEISSYIATASPGAIIILDAPSCRGKTQALHKAKELIGDGMLILSYETLVLDIVRYLRSDDADSDVTDALPPLIKKCTCFAIEDIDFLAEKTATQECICKIVNKISAYKTTVVVLTGIDIATKMPDFVNRLNRAEYIKFN